MLHLKTDDELRFFVENPAYYQAELVQAARQELRRRYPAPAVPSVSAAPPVLAAPAPAPLVAPALAPVVAPAQPLATPYAEPEAPPRRAGSWVLPTSVAVVLLLAGLGFWHKASRHRPAPARLAAPARPAAPAAPRPLETAVSAPPLPTFEVEGCVEQALTRVPAAEKADEQHLHQYQAISRRFWAAQPLSAHLLEQAQRGQPNPLFKSQALLVLGLWHDFDRTLIYSYDFGPVMGDHLRRMKAVARQQRAALTVLANAATLHQPLRLTDAQLVAGQQALPQLLAPLQPNP